MSTWVKKDLLYEGKAKRIYRTQTSGYVWIEYTDKVTAGDGTRRDEFAGKGSVTAGICALAFSSLTQNQIANHFVEAVSPTEHVARDVQVIPLEVVVRGIAAGSITKRLGFSEGAVFEQPFVEFYYKNDALHDPLVTVDHIRELHLAAPETLTALEQNALNVFRVLQRFFAQHSIALVDTKLEYGWDASGNLLVADEISPDTCRLWDRVTGQSLDKDRFRRQEDGLLQGYEEVYRRLSVR